MSAESIEFGFEKGVPAGPGSAHGPDTIVKSGDEIVAGSDLSEPDLQISGVGTKSELARKLFPSGDGPPIEMGPEFAAGCQIDQFIIEKRIGLGGMGAVFRAKDSHLEREVALKILSPTLSREGTAVQRFLNEARSAARLDNEHIARVFQYGQTKGLHYIAFEFIEGLNVREMIARKGRLSVEQAIIYTTQIVSALRFTSAAGVIHRDIKPSNIIITPQGKAKLVDLGLARKPTTESVDELTVPGTTLGTFDYIAPEQAKDPRQVDVRSDIYSLGCTFYHMLTGEPPYPEGTLLQKLLDHQGKQVPDAQEKNSQVPSEIAAICRKMMASDPAQRFQSPDELLTEMLDQSGRLGLHMVPAESTQVTRIPQEVPFAQKYAVWIVSAVLLIATIIVIEQLPSGADQPIDALNSFAAANQSSNESDSSEGTLIEPDASTELASQDKKPTAYGKSSTGGPEELAVSGPNSSAKPSEGSASGTGIKGSTTESTPGGELIASVSSPGSLSSPTKPGLGDGNSGSTARTTTPPTAPSTPVRTVYAQNEGIRLITDRAGVKLTYNSLQEACRAAKNEDIIELAFDGPALSGPEMETIRLENKSISIRPAKRPETGEHYKPEIEFSIPALPGDGNDSPFSLVDSTLNLTGVQLKATVPVRSSEWSFFSLSNREKIRLTRCNITVSNQVARTATVFLTNVPSARASRIDPLLETTGVEDKFDIEIVDSMICGQSSLFATGYNGAGRIRLQNSIVAVDNAVLRLSAGIDVITELTSIEFDCDRSTFRMGAGFISAADDDPPYDLIPVRASAKRSIFVITGDAPFVSMVGKPDDRDSLQRAFTWSGEDNRYEGIADYWVLSIPGSLDQGFAMQFGDWVNYWSELSQNGDELSGKEMNIPWETPIHYVPVSELTRELFRISSDDLIFSDNVYGSDGEIVGASPRLPR
ncbi:serine/threonine-protein kinase [Calycomorphotria hydatis]|uniref:Serine/threonine-protein kinase StkP n=1 Tax=Calycomorphotria hydatis TaxID=2528027 RepID=A0A517TB15_9PLAN|nr:serine/threonine-protein kinase [Calycomorphotria hydatis]QDT65565.1 Serine/threonine-protein kinase StkP [Calycomorphotria hydatis]